MAGCSVRFVALVEDSSVLVLFPFHLQAALQPFVIGDVLRRIVQYV